MKESTSSMSIILVDKKNQSSGNLGAWLTKGGFITRRANDLGQAIEALSDFTVRLRPDIVLLEVSSLARDFDSLQSAFQLSSQNDDIVVLALSDDNASEKNGRFFAKNFDQLRTVINQTRATYSLMA